MESYTAPALVNPSAPATLRTRLSADECIARLSAATVSAFKASGWKAFTRDALNAYPFMGSVNGTEFRIRRYWPAANQGAASVSGRIVAADHGALIQLKPATNTAPLTIFVVLMVLMLIPAVSLGSWQGVLVGLGFVAAAVSAVGFARRQWRKDLAFIDEHLREVLQAE